MDMGLFGPFYDQGSPKTQRRRGYIFEFSPRYWNISVSGLSRKGTGPYISIPLPWTYGGFCVTESGKYLQYTWLSKLGISAKRLDSTKGKILTLPPISNISSYGNPCGFTVYSPLSGPGRCEIDHDDPLELLNLGYSTITIPRFNSDYRYHVTTKFVKWVAEKTKTKLDPYECANDDYLEYLKYLKAWSKLTPQQMKTFPWVPNLTWDALKKGPNS